MRTQSEPEGIDFIEGGAVDVAQLNELYRIVGWDRTAARTASKTERMLEVSNYYVTASVGGSLVGFARVCGDPYVAQVLDVITHPRFRRRGIASSCMRRVVDYLERSDYASVTLTDGGELPDFYDQFGFRPLTGAESRVWIRSARVP